MAFHSRKRDTKPRPKPRAALVAGPFAVLATLAAVSVGVVVHEPASTDTATDTAASASEAPPSATVPDTADRSADRAPVSRSTFDRAPEVRLDKLSPVELATAPAATSTAVKAADTRLWTTAPLNLWTGPGQQATTDGLVQETSKVLVTGRSLLGRDEVVVDGASRWVTAGYLSKDKPVVAVAAASDPAGSGTVAARPTTPAAPAAPVAPAAPAAPAGLSMEPCPDPGVESGLTSGAIYVYRSVCHAFPQITTYGGYDAHGEHASGKALDIMTSDSALGTSIADFLMSHASELGLYDIIWQQRIWTPVRASEGWRLMPSRGSATADHYDHVHVSVN